MKGNVFLRNITFKILLKIDNITYSNIKDILSEIDAFILSKNDIFDGELIQIYNINNKKRSRGTEEVMREIQSTEIIQVDNIDELINKIFIENNGHITKLINKSQRPEIEENFVGCLVWSIPFHNKICSQEIEKSFNRVLDLDFDLFVYTGGMFKDKHNFIVKSNK